jgi:hypothetical protein
MECWFDAVRPGSDPGTNARTSGSVRRHSTSSPGPASVLPRPSWRTGGPADRPVAGSPVPPRPVGSPETAGDPAGVVAALPFSSPPTGVVVAAGVGFAVKRPADAGPAAVDGAVSGRRRVMVGGL